MKYLYRMGEFDKKKRMNNISTGNVVLLDLSQFICTDFSSCQACGHKGMLMELRKHLFTPTSQGRTTFPKCFPFEQRNGVAYKYCMSCICKLIKCWNQTLMDRNNEKRRENMQFQMESHKNVAHHIKISEVVCIIDDFM